MPDIGLRDYMDIPEEDCLPRHSHRPRHICEDCGRDLEPRNGRHYCPYCEGIEERDE